MSFTPCPDPTLGDAASADAIETLIVPRAVDLGEMTVRRALPSRERQMVGPFIFFDQMGPAEFLTDQGIDVRPHPHINLSTLTYLFEGEILHRDSLGTELAIEPGAVNLMTAGQGITHSERADGDYRQQPKELFGIQTWMALPASHEDAAADFEHVAKADLPVIEAEGKRVRLILGDAYGERTSAQHPSRMFYADAVLEAGAAIPLPDDHEDRGVYVLEGSVQIGADTFEAGRMMVFRPGDRLSMTAGPAGARVMLLGGDTLGGPRYIWWNFVASSKERIEAAKEAWREGDWEHGRFQLPPGDDREHIPAPDR